MTGQVKLRISLQVVLGILSSSQSRWIGRRRNDPATARLGIAAFSMGQRRPCPAGDASSVIAKTGTWLEQNYIFLDIEIFTKRLHAQHMPQVGQERRGLVRRSRQYSSWITMESDIRSHECRVLNLSANGAKLLADIDAPIGSKLWLSIVPHTIVRRECEVVWRKGRMIGVKFAVGVEKNK